MPNQTRIPCDVFQIAYPDWSQIDEKSREAIAEVFANWSEFTGAKPSRKGFFGFNREANLIAGFYTQEDLRQGLEGIV